MDFESIDELEAGGIEPRNPDLEVVLKQALTRLGQQGLASCLVLLCRHPSLVRLVEAWPKLSTDQKRLLLTVINERGDQ